MSAVKNFLYIKDDKLVPYELKKVNQLNTISAYCIALALLLSIINVFLGRYPQVLIDFSIIWTIFLPVILIQKKGHYSLARNYFTFFMLFMMTGICLFNISNNQFPHTENVFLTLAPALVILYEGKSRLFIYSFTTLLFLTIHAYAFEAMGADLDSEFYTNSMVYLAVFLAIFHYVNSFKTAYYKVYHSQVDLINQLENHKKELEKTHETKNKLFSIVAHDLKRPMHMLTGLLRMEDMIPEEELKQYKTQVKENVKGINSLIDNVLTWAKSQLEGFNVDAKHTELRKLFSSEMDVYREQAEVKGIDLSVNIPPNLKVYSDPNHVSLVFRNIVNNSIKFTPTDGQILISANAQKNHVDIIIKDTGVGMDQETIEKIRSQKFVSSTTGTQGETGSGLGLVLCSETLQKIGGKLHIKSIKNHGSQFIIQLPLN